MQVKCVERRARVREPGSEKERGFCFVGRMDLWQKRRVVARGGGAAGRALRCVETGKEGALIDCAAEG